MADRLRVTVTRTNLAPIAFAAAPGECIAITGPSGAGKSLLLRMIADLDPHEGEAWLDGRRRAAMSAPEWRRQVVYCPAESGWWHRDVGAHFSQQPPLEAATALGLSHALFARELRLCSTGERQRLALLRALALNSPVLLLDEPTGALDAENVARVEALLQARLNAGTTILLVTHDPAQAHRLGRRHFTLADGKLTAA